MALNFSHRPVFSAHLSEDNLVSPIRIANGCFLEGIPERSHDGFGRPWHLNREVENLFDYGRERFERGGTQESVSSDILDLLPSDPFGMGITTTFTAFTGWLEDLEVGCGGYGRDEAVASDGSYQLFADLNFICNKAMSYQAFPASAGIDDKSNVGNGFGWSSVEEGGAGASHHVDFGSTSAENSSPSLGDGSWAAASCHVDFGSTSAESSTPSLGDESWAAASCRVDFGSTSAENSIPSLGNESWAVASCHVDFGPTSVEKSTPSLGDGSCGIASSGSDCSGDHGDGIFSHEDGGAPPSGFVFALGHLGLRDLLVLESVCKSLRTAICGEPFFWKSIHIEQPLNEKITDDILLQLTNKAQGNLECLSLVECPRITDDGLRRVLESNPKLTKLSVPGCTRLTVEGIMNSLRAFNSTGAQGVKHLRIGGIYGVTLEIFEEMKKLLGTGGKKQESSRKPRFHIRGSLYLPRDDDRDIDIETCPRCQNQRLVYDCPTEICKGKDHATQLCRACTLCIARCVRCGRCINDNEYEETFCLELLCSVCWHELKLLEDMDRNVGLNPSPFAAPVEQTRIFSFHG